MNRDTNDFFRWNDELSDRETILIGKIIAQWGALEYEVFLQTLMSFDAPDGENHALPKAMNNLQFTQVIGLWKERVVDKTEGERGKFLQQQYERILKLKEFRDALAHGMWQWSVGQMNRISAVRIRKKEIISVHFTVDDLVDFFDQLGSINFKIRYPGGIEELAQKRSEGRFYSSRAFAKELLTSLSAKNDHEP
jgi:hypothetical protein